VTQRWMLVAAAGTAIVAGIVDRHDLQAQAQRPSFRGHVSHALLALRLSPRGDRSGLRRAMRRSPTMPSADFCAAVRNPHGSFSPSRDTTQISRGKLERRRRTPAGSTRLAVMELADFAEPGPLVRPDVPDIWLLFVRSRLCSTLPSDGASRRRPCASLALHLHQVGQRTFTSKLSNMLGTPGPVDAKSTRTQVLGKLQNSFPRASTGTLIFIQKGTFLSS
jgi:hypothetical protein